MTDEQLYLFDRLAFCWKHFEGDGLNDQNMQSYIERFKEPILIVGSGQGLVANPLKQKGIDFHCIDASQKMADFSINRFNIKTEVVDFLHYYPQRKFRGIVVNTGVLYSGFVQRNHVQFVEKLKMLLKPNGRVLLTFFQITDFDITAEELGLCGKGDLLVRAWRFLQQGGSLGHFLMQEYSERPDIGFIVLKHNVDLLEFENQIKNACLSYKKKKHSISIYHDIEDFVIHALPYVSYGLSRKNQLTLFSALNKYGFALDIVDVKEKLVIAVLSYAGERLE